LKKVLIVEDRGLWRKFLERSLQKMGYIVETAEDGVEGLNKAFSFVPDVFILDVIIPGIRGYQLCRLLRKLEAFEKAGILIMTASNEPFSKFWAAKSGADYFISKDKNGEDILKEITEILSNLDFRSYPEKLSKEIVNTNMDIPEILDHLLLQETLKSEIMSLVEYINDEDYVGWRITDLVLQVTRSEIVGVMIVGVDTGRIYVASDGKYGICTEDLKKLLISHMERHHYPERWYIKNTTFHLDTSIPDDFVWDFFLIKSQKEELGILGVLAKGLDRIERESLKTITESLTAFVKLLNLVSSYRNMAEYDELTLLRNYRSFMDQLMSAFNSYKKKKTFLSLAIMDIDDFKRVNDSYGHPVGNEVLKEISRIMRDIFDEDKNVIARYGGEEFSVLLENTDSSDALEFCETFRKAVEEYDWYRIAEGLHITISIGITGTDLKSYRTAMEMVKDADRALYIAKRLGKNRVELYRRGRT